MTDAAKDAVDDVNGTGRSPRRFFKETRRQLFHLRLTVQEKTQLRFVAQTQGLPMTDVIRKLLEQEYRRLLKKG